jgi:hypothetical protein
MRNIKEDILQFAWKYRCYNSSGLRTTQDETVEVIQQGEWNSHSGPDFSNAKIRIGDTLWAGNIEIHHRSSDFRKHNHQHDAAYDTIILHVVYDDDEPLVRKDGHAVPTLVLSSFLSEGFLESAEKLLIKSQHNIPCAWGLKYIPDIVVGNTLEKRLVERIELKTKEVKMLLEHSTQSWETVFYIMLARHFGMKVNSEPFEWLAKSIPLNLLTKHKDNLLQIEALLLGQSGLISGDFRDEYILKLQNEYTFLKSKYQLSPQNKSNWKWMRLRPANFPTIRLAQFASLIHQSSHLFSRVLESTSVKELRNFFSADVSPYWKTHYKPDSEIKKTLHQPGNSFIENIIINTVVPVVYLYGKERGLEEIQQKALNWLEEIKPENNFIIRKWLESEIKVEHAADTQALIQLYNFHCKFKKCLECPIGTYLIKN